MKKLILSFSLICLSLSFVFPQEKAKPDQWKGFVLNESTASQVLEKFGKPQSDKVGKVRMFTIGKLLTKELDKEKWRTIHYETLENAKDAKFIFDENGVLSIIQFEVKDLKPEAFVNAYDVEFKPQFSGFDRAVNAKDFRRDGQGNVYAQNYPTVYNLFGESENAYVVAMIGNSSFGSVLGRSMGIPDSTLTYPGKILMVQLISTKLKNADGVDVLK